MDNRISQVSVGVTLDRATNKNEFGQMLARGIASGTNLVGGVASGLIPGGAVISAAINQTTSRALSGSRGGNLAGVGGSGMPSTSTGSSGNAVSVSSDSMQQQEAQLQADKTTMGQYLNLQWQMQQESQRYSAITNIMKVRHESSKSSINNLR